MSVPVIIVLVMVSGSPLLCVPRVAKTGGSRVQHIREDRASVSQVISYASYLSYINLLSALNHVCFCNEPQDVHLRRSYRHLRSANLPRDSVDQLQLEAGWSVSMLPAITKGSVTYLIFSPLSRVYMKSMIILPIPSSHATLAHHPLVAAMKPRLLLALLATSVRCDLVSRDDAAAVPPVYRTVS